MNCYPSKWEESVKKGRIGFIQFIDVEYQNDQNMLELVRKHLLDIYIFNMKIMWNLNHMNIYEVILLRAEGRQVTDESRSSSS